MGFAVGNSGASTTAGYVSFTLINLTGAATSSYAQATTSIEYQISF
jgi:hypothetical protein